MQNLVKISLLAYKIFGIPIIIKKKLLFSFYCYKRSREQCISFCSIYPQNLEQVMWIMSNVRKSCMGSNIMCLITGDNVDKFCMHVSSRYKKKIIINMTFVTRIILWKLLSLYQEWRLTIMMMSTWDFICVTRNQGRMQLFHHSVLSSTTIRILFIIMNISYLFRNLF